MVSEWQNGTETLVMIIDLQEPYFKKKINFRPNLIYTRNKRVSGPFCYSLTRGNNFVYAKNK